jgi:hypothetical protein
MPWLPPGALGPLGKLEAGPKDLNCRRLCKQEIDHHYKANKGGYKKHT